MRVRFSKFVAGDLEAIGDFIAQDSPRHAVRFLAEIMGKIRSLGKAPLHYQLRPEIGKDARLAVVGQYVILFRVDDDTVRIERVVFGGRELICLLQPPPDPTL